MSVAVVAVLATVTALHFFFVTCPSFYLIRLDRRSDPFLRSALRSFYRFLFGQSVIRCSIFTTFILAETTSYGKSTDNSERSLLNDLPGLLFYGCFALLSSRLGNELGVLRGGHWVRLSEIISNWLFGAWAFVILSYLVLLILIANDSREVSEISDTLSTGVTLIRVFFVAVSFAMGAYVYWVARIASTVEDSSVLARFSVQKTLLVRCLHVNSVVLVLRPFVAAVLFIVDSSTSDSDLLEYDSSTSSLLVTALYYPLLETLPCFCTLYFIGGHEELGTMGSLFTRSLKGGSTRSLPDAETEAQLKQRLLHSEFEVPAAELVIIERIGAGSAGTVFKARWRGTVVALKKLHFPLFSDASVPEEVVTMAKLRHPYVVQFLGFTYFTDEGPDKTIALLTEYLEGGSLYHYLHAQTTPLNWHLVTSLISDIAQGMAHLHSQSICHRDLKTLNVLLTKHLDAKICDFGISQAFDFTRTLQTNTLSFVGTVAYLAPELIAGRKFSPPKLDVYAFGVVCFESMTCQDPYPPTWRMYQIQERVLSGFRPTFPERCHQFAPDLVSLAQECWSQNAQDRPTFEVILSRLERLKFRPTSVTESITSHAQSTNSSPGGTILPM